jgi:hypothetical protein
MTTLILIENVLGSGEAVSLTETFGAETITRELRPGETARLVVSAFKSICVAAQPARRRGSGDSWRGAQSLPMALERRSS